jgi:predicted nuclease of restriction endonuclease-like (RecB) superfamily
MKKQSDKTSIDSHPSPVTLHPLFDRIVSILEQARTNVVRSVNSEMVLAYWHIGREIVQEMQGGEERAEYGKRLIQDLSAKLTSHYGKGFSLPNLKLFRQFYTSFADRSPGIGYTACSQSKQLGFSQNLGWSHYRVLMRVGNLEARGFYEVEADRQGWSVSQLERQKNSFFYERLTLSKDKKRMLLDANAEKDGIRPIDVLRDPYVLEFLNLPEPHNLSETKLEAALISCLQDFLLELGSGFALIGRQKRLTLDGDHFYPDLIFYHTRLKCYVVIDLKTGKLTHGDLGQMQMYVNFYDREIRTPGDNPTVGLLLCAEKNDAVVRYVLGEENEQIFASKYRFELPSIEELQKELSHERDLIENILPPLEESAPTPKKRGRRHGKG